MTATRWRSTWQNASIATRLFVLSAAWTFFVLLLGGLLLTTYYRRQSQHAFDERLGVYLRALVADVADTSGADEEPGGLGDPQFELVASGRYWQITRVDGDTHTTRTSKSLFSAHLPKLADFGVPPGIGGSRSGTVTGPGGKDLRIVERTIDTGDNGIYLVQVAATAEEVAAQTARFELALGLVFAMLAIGLLATAALQVRFGLRPLRMLEGAVEGVRLGQRDRIVGQYPPDLAPLADELNLLIATNGEIVERARLQVGNLAHALKTPLSVLTNEEPGTDTAFGEKVREQATIMRDQIGYYLDRARVAARANAIGTATDIGPALDGLIRTFRKIYPDRSIALEPAPALRFLGERQDFEEMAGNIIDNACKWAGRDVSVRASVETVAAGRSHLVLTIDDDGPGLPPEQRSEAVKRGRRLDETKPGSGLGLSIVSDLAAAYRGTFALETAPTGGLRAVLHLPGAGGMVHT